MLLNVTENIIYLTFWTC